MPRLEADMTNFLDANRKRMAYVTNTVHGDINAMNADVTNRLMSLTPVDTEATKKNWLLAGRKVDRNTVEYTLQQDPAKPFHPTSRSRQFPSGVYMFLLVIWLNAGTRAGPFHKATRGLFFLERVIAFLIARSDLLVKRWDGRLKRIDSEHVTAEVRA